MLATPNMSQQGGQMRATCCAQQQRPLASSFEYDTANRKPQSEVRRLPFDVKRVFNSSNASVVFHQNKGFMGNIIDFATEQNTVERLSAGSASQHNLSFIRIEYI